MSNWKLHSTNIYGEPNSIPDALQASTDLLVTISFTLPLLNISSFSPKESNITVLCVCSTKRAHKRARVKGREEGREM